MLIKQQARHLHAEVHWLCTAIFSHFPLSPSHSQCSRTNCHGLHQNGGEVLWLRTNATGKTQQRVFSTAECFITNPKLRRRVALSLSGRGNRGNDGAQNTMTPTSAPAAFPVVAAKAVVEATMNSQRVGTRDQPHIRFRHRPGLLFFCSSWGSRVS